MLRVEPMVQLLPVLTLAPLNGKYGIEIGNLVMLRQQ